MQEQSSSGSRPPPPVSLQAQTRGALLRALQEDEEHWASPEDPPCSLAQDVCEVGRRLGPGRCRLADACLCGGWRGTPCLPPLIPAPIPCSTQLLEEHTERAPRISQEFGERMAHCCLGGLAEFLQR